MYIYIHVLGVHPYLEDHPRTWEWLIARIGKFTKYGCFPSKRSFMVTNYVHILKKNTLKIDSYPLKRNLQYNRKIHLPTTDFPGH